MADSITVSPNVSAPKPKLFCTLIWKIEELKTKEKEPTEGKTDIVDEIDAGFTVSNQTNGVILALRVPSNIIFVKKSCFDPTNVVYVFSILNRDFQKKDEFISDGISFWPNNDKIMENAYDDNGDLILQCEIFEKPTAAAAGAVNESGGGEESAAQFLRVLYVESNLTKLNEEFLFDYDVALTIQKQVFTFNFTAEKNSTNNFSIKSNLKTGEYISFRSSTGNVHCFPQIGSAASTFTFKSKKINLLRYYKASETTEKFFTDDHKLITFDTTDFSESTMEMLWSTRPYADFTIKFPDEEIKVHKFVLAEQCNSDSVLTTETELCETRFNLSTVNEVMKFIYLGTIPDIVTYDFLLALIAYDVKGALIANDQFGFMDKTNVENCVAMLRLAEREKGCPALRKHVISMIKDYVRGPSGKAIFMELSEYSVDVAYDVFCLK